MNTSRSEGAPRDLPIRVRETLTAGKAQPPPEQTVYCPQVVRSVAIARCSGCDKCEVVVIGPEVKQPHVRCREPDPHATPDTLTASSSKHIPTELLIASLLEHTAVSAVMSTRVVCVDESLPTQRLMDLLVAEGFSGAPVVDREGRPKGIVSKTDLLREAHERERDEPPPGKAEDVMTHSAFGLPERASLAQAAALMAFERVHRVPILSDDGKVVGIISPLDITRWLAMRAGYVVPDQRRGR